MIAYKSWAIPEGNVVSVSQDGVVLWQLNKEEPSLPIVLEVEKITSDTYAGETTYTGESFVLLNIYPKTNGTVNVTYGGLTKTVTDTSGSASPNAQTVFFGTFNGVSDSVTTPTSGTLTIEGEYRGFSCSNFATNSKGTALGGKYCSCITNVIDFGELTNISAYAFYGCTKLTLTSLPSSITEIGDYAFYNCASLNFSDNFFKNGLVSIGKLAFVMNSDEALCEKFDSITIPQTVTTIGNKAFIGPVIDAHNSNILKRVIMLPTTPPTGLGTEYLCFGKVYSTFKIIVPKGCGNTYKSAEGWSSYANYIVEAS